MTCPDAKTWNLLSMNLLDEALARSLRQHALECQRCHAAWQEASRRHTELLETFSKTFDCDHDQRRDQLMALLPVSVPLCKEESDASRRWWPNKGEIAMTLRRHKTGWAAAALVPVVCCVLLLLLLTTGEKLAFADVLEKIRQAKTMTCDFVTTVTVEKGLLPGEPTGEPMQGTISMLFDGEKYSTLIEGEKSVKGKATKGKIRFLMLGDRGYVWVDGKVRFIDASLSGIPPATENWLNRLLEVRESPDRNLGEKEINGRRAAGFEIVGWKLGLGARPTEGNPTPNDSDIRLRVWVDLEQNLPIRLEIKQKQVMPRQSRVVTIDQQWDNIKWNVPLDPARFQPPSQEELGEEPTMKLPAIDEAAFVDGMRIWLKLEKKAKVQIDKFKKKAKDRGGELPRGMAQVFEGAAINGGYPERLDASWLTNVFSIRAALASLEKTVPEQKPVPENLSKEERQELIRSRGEEAAKASAKAGVKAATEVSPKATAIAAFYQKLANEKREPRYFGATVTPGDAEAILLQWKLDDGRYRVIRGDLKAETVDSVD